MNPRVIKETHYLHQMVFCSKMQISLYVFFLKRAWELRIVMLTPTYCIKWFFHVQSVTNPCFVNYSILLCSCSLQSRCRCYLAHSQYVRLMKATITAQCGWRRRVARRELRNLKMVRDPLFKHHCTSFLSYLSLLILLSSCTNGWSFSYQQISVIWVKNKHIIGFTKIIVILNIKSPLTFFCLATSFLLSGCKRNWCSTGCQKQTREGSRRAYLATTAGETY
jgi:hypothetical protein